MKSSTSSRSSTRWIESISVVAILLVGLWRAIQLKWISDDAFITLRYVKNFVEGYGIVYNIGERAEGYTHFLWLLLLSATSVVGLDPVEASMWLGIVAFAAILAFLLLISHKEKEKSGLWVPLGAGLFALNYDNTIWASGGLETSLYAILILCAFYIWFYSKLEETKRLLFSGLLLALTSLTRPDGILFTATAVALLAARAFQQKDFASGLKRIVILAVPTIIIGVPYLIWKYNYYGDILPLTYYAKSGGHSYFSQGMYYIALYFRVYLILAIAIIASGVILIRSKKADKSERGSPVIAAACASLIYLLVFVARSGGDFMFARFLIPVVPFLVLLIEYALRSIQIASAYRLAIAVVLLSGVVLENSHRSSVLFHTNEADREVSNWNLKGEGSTQGIADERWEYYYGHYVVDGEPRGSMEIYSSIGKYLEPYFRDLPVTVAIPGGKNMVAYYANFRTCINEFGLTDSFIAHLPTNTLTGRIGHEKHAPVEYLQRRRTDFELFDAVPELPTAPMEDAVAFEIADPGLWQLARIITYDTSNIDHLRRRFASTNRKMPFLSSEH